MKIIVINYQKRIDDLKNELKNIVANNNKEENASNLSLMNRKLSALFRYFKLISNSLLFINNNDSI